MAGIRNTHASPSRQKEAVLPEDLIAMLETLDRGSLRGMRDRAMLLIGFAGGSGQRHEQNARQIGPFAPFRLSDPHLMMCAQIASSEEIA